MIDDLKQAEQDITKAVLFAKGELDAMEKLPSSTETKQQVFTNILNNFKQIADKHLEKKT